MTGRGDREALRSALANWDAAVAATRHARIKAEANGISLVFCTEDREERLAHDALIAACRALAAGAPADGGGGDADA